jgi:TP901 family phage tail tape measure protein
MDVGNLNIKITADTRGVDAGISKTKRALGDVTNTAQGFGSKLQAGFDAVGIGGALAIGAVTAAVGKFATDSVKAAVSFDSSMANINSILQLSGTEIDALGGKILAFGATTRAGPQAAAEAFYEIVSGVADASTHMAILEASVATAEAGNADLTATTGALVSVMNSYGFSAEEASFASDVLTKTVGAGVGSMDEFASALGMSAGLAAQSGISFDELGGSMAYLTTQGFSAAQAGTRLTAITTAFLKPNEKMKKALRLMGVESGSAGLEMYGLAGMTQLLSESMGGSTDAMSEALGTTEALTGALALNGPGFEEFIENFEATAEGATEAARAIQNASTAASFDRFNAQVERAQVLLGNLAMPVLEGAANVVVTGLQAGADIITEVQKLGENWGILLAQGAREAFQEKFNIDPTFKLRADGDRGAIRQALMDMVMEPGGIQASFLLNPKFHFAADMADDFVTVVTTEIAGIKPIEAILSTIPKFLPPAIPNTIAAMNELITGIQEQGLSPTQQLIIDTVAHVQFTTAMDKVKADVYNTNRPEPRMSADYMLPEPAPPAEAQTWADGVIAQYQAAIDLASQTPLQAALTIDIAPSVNRTTSDPLLDTAVKEYTSTALKDTTILTPADLTIVPTLFNGPLVEEDMRGQLTALNYDSPGTAAMRIMAGLANGSEVAAAITTGLQSQDYDTTVSATLTVLQTTKIIQTGLDTLYDAGVFVAPGMNHPSVGGGENKDNNIMTPMATGGKVPYDNFAALLHKGEIVVPADYADSVGRGGGVTVIVNASNLMGSRQEVIEWVREGMAEAGY